MQGWLALIIYVILVISSIAAWINTKIILEEIDKIKKHIGMPEEKPIDSLISYDNLNDDKKKVMKKSDYNESLVFSQAFSVFYS
ncbi:hypothetical protein [Tepidibacillus decaturensis]|nr:hypothetical protein [Tepidibacillus decaturensis]